ncbi:hypothetical protein NDU88_005703 [Pleurodeles waltl]|uniref:Uncharacterized protein n=1 Tax=Pleurodeles waltl TaxID=8319 RepID=A0AAV7TY20_PLEWA|nr:hypothetical protein NDU88_005703 [Pleurodeles waltl]
MRKGSFPSPHSPGNLLSRFVVKLDQGSGRDTLRGGAAAQRKIEDWGHCRDSLVQTGEIQKEGGPVAGRLVSGHVVSD